MTLSYSKIFPKSDIDSLVILIHGYGSSGQNMIHLAESISYHFPLTGFIAPNAPNIVNTVSHFGSSGHQWFDFRDQSDKQIRDGVIGAGNILKEFVEQQANTFSISHDKIALIGFSQGVFVSLRAGLTMNKNISCIIGCSGGFVPMTLDEVLSKPIVKLIHGDQDHTLSHSYSLVAQESLKSLGINSSIEIIEGMHHTINNEVQKLIVSYLDTSWQR